MRIFFLIFLASVPFTSHAETEWETDLDADLTLVAGFFNDDEAIETKPGQAEVSISGSASHVFENGLKLTTNLTFRGQIDHPSRPGFAGAIIECPPATAQCADNGSGQALRGAFSRLSTEPFNSDVGPRGSLERAYVELDGGWGSVTLGRDDGVAARFYEGSPTMFRLARDRDPILDPTGINAVRTRNDISSTAEKASYVTPRILGVRAGISYTPDASVRRLDLDTKIKAPNVIEPELDDAIELGLQASRLFREADLRARASLTWSQANSASAFYDDTETVSGGLEIERRDQFRVGISALNSNNGGYGDYSSLTLGGEYTIGDWNLGIHGSRAEDETIHLKSESLTFGVSRNLNENVGLSVGYRTGRTELAATPTGISDNIDQQGVLLELRIRK
tara:strand:+ start:3333 stop:4514 length:1182 start_codon:yes stop_codon:yes gene_type:complete